MNTPHFHSLRVAELHHETADAVSLGFVLPAALRDVYRYTPGQYLTLRTTLAGQEVRRAYSICSAPYETLLRVAIKRVDGGVFSTWAKQDLRQGDLLDVMTPDGRFGITPAPDQARNYVGFAAGSGITPIMAILKAVLHDEPGSRCLLFYGNRTTASIIFRSELEDLKDRFMSRLSVFHVLSREQQDLAVLNGHLDADKVRHLMHGLAPASVDHAFVCGPQPMIEGLPATLVALGLPYDRVHVERFTPAAGGSPRAVPISASAPAKALATVICDGVTSAFPVAEGEAIIDAAIRAGLNLPYSCKGGICCTCRAKLLEGEVAMAVNYSLEPWETAAGYILTCQSQPVTARVLIDYDQV